LALLITGAASGIGLAAGKRMAQRMPVIATDANFEALLAATSGLGHQPFSILPMHIDVTRRDSVKAVVSEANRQLGPITALFNCAGINIRSPFADIAEQHWDRMIDVHVRGSIVCAQAVLPSMCEQRSGTIVNMASDYAVVGMPGSVTYSAAKSAVYSLTKSLALEFAPFNVRVNALGPGPIDTPLLRANRDDDEWERAIEYHKSRIPMRRLGLPNEIASVLEFLVSERSSYMTGQLIQPNGGQVTW